MSMKHSNIRELTAIFLDLKTLKKMSKGKNILVLSDNMTSMAYINMQGCPCPEISRIATNIWALLVDNQADIVARHLSGSKNVVADRCRNLKLLSVTPSIKLPRVEQFCIPVGIGMPEP